MRNAERAFPAQTRTASSRRNSMIGKIQVARNQLGMQNDDYRALLFDTTGQISLKDCSDGQLVAMIDALKGKGFQPLPGKRKSKPLAQHDMARKARAMWISLYNLNVVHNREEVALEAFAKRQLGCERLAWAKQSEGGKLIEALKGMATRNGWKQVDHKGAPLGPLGLNEGVCLAILERLKDAGAVPDGWTLNFAAHRLLDITTDHCGPYTVELYQRIAVGLGDVLRASGVPQGDRT